MTLTELKYLIVLASEKHFGKAAKRCFVSQPTLSVAIKNLEEELQVKIFERKHGTLTVTAQGQTLVHQAVVIAEQIALLKDLARQISDPLSGEVKIGLIFTVAPYLLPYLMPELMKAMPKVQPILQEDYTDNLLQLLYGGIIDCAILAEPFENKNFATAKLYQETFWAAVPAKHRIVQHELQCVDIKSVAAEKILLLNKDNCWHRHVLDALNDHLSNKQEQLQTYSSFTHSSLTTLLHMVAAGVGVSVVPASCVPAPVLQLPAAQLWSKQRQNSVIYLPLQQSSFYRTISLVWRRSFPQYKLMAELRNAVMNCGMGGVKYLNYN